MARLINFQDKKTWTYAQLWSRDPFVATTWYRAVLPSEEKGDERGIGATHKVDVVGPCFVVWEGTLPNGARTLRLVNATGDLANPPGEAFLPLYPGVNLIEFTSDPPGQGGEPLPDDPLPAEPEPEPDEQPPPPIMPIDRPPRTITIYPDRRDKPMLVWWGDDLVVVVPSDWYADAWAGPKGLLERIRESE